MIMDESHRTDLSAQVPSFVARAEGMIARELRAVENLFHVALDDTDRHAADSPIYHLPDDFLEDKTVTASSRILRKVGRDGLIKLSGSAPVLLYHMRGDADNAWIEFRGTPATDEEIGLDYYGRMPALSADGDTNRLLNNHDTIYLHAALFFLYMWTQDTELAQSSLEIWQNAVATLNEQAGRYVGGTGVTPSLNLGHFSPGGSY
jgi:hypothetical protein